MREVCAFVIERRQVGARARASCPRINRPKTINRAMLCGRVGSREGDYVFRIVVSVIGSQPVSFWPHVFTSLDFNLYAVILYGCIASHTIIGVGICLLCMYCLMMGCKLKFNVV